MADVKSGLYTFSKSGVHYVGGKAHTGTMVITDTLARDPYVERLVDAGQLKYVGPVLTETQSGPKLISRVAPETPELASTKPTSDGHGTWKSSKKSK